jgi:hypothetical protein
VTAPPDRAADDVDNELCLKSGQVNVLQVVVAPDLRQSCRCDVVPWDPIELAADFKR